MAYVITQKCLGEVYAACQAVCPADCIHAGKYQNQSFMVIDPDECIDCGVCEPECPVEAILPDTEEEAEKWLELNREFSTGPWPNITRKREPPPDADDFRDVPGKYEKYFSAEPGQGS